MSTQLFSIGALRARGGRRRPSEPSYLDPKTWDTKVISPKDWGDNVTSVESERLQIQDAHLCKERFDHLTDARLDVIVFGIMRNFQSTWPTVQKQLQLSEIESCGVRVNVVVSTSLQVRCTDKDYLKGWCSKVWQTWSEDEFKKAIRTTYGSRLRYIFDTRAEGTTKVAELLESDEGSVYTVLKDAGLRLRSGMNPSISGVTIILRADAVFTTDYVDPVATCKLQPGYNYISGSFERPCFWHQRDWDFGGVACDARVLKLAFARPETCDRVWPGCFNGTDEPPPLPKGFSGSWRTPCNGKSIRACGTLACNSVISFMKHDAFLGTLDAHGIFLDLLRPNGSLFR
jgi:hypothetical protein